MGTKSGVRILTILKGGSSLDEMKGFSTDCRRGVYRDEMEWRRSVGVDAMTRRGRGPSQTLSESQKTAFFQDHSCVMLYCYKIKVLIVQ